MGAIRLRSTALAMTLTIGAGVLAATPASARPIDLLRADLPVPAQDVSSSDKDLGDARNEVVAVRTSADGRPDVVKYRAGSAADAARLVASLNARPGVSAGLNTVLRVDPPGEITPTAASRRTGSRIELPISTLAIGDNEPRRAEQWGLDAVQSPVAWAKNTGASLIVAVVDTGVDATHPDLAGRLLPQLDLPNDDLVGDVNGHGTHVSGIVAAGLNGIGVVGAAPAARVLPIRVTDPQGELDDATGALGIRTAVDRGAKVINLSWGSPDATTGIASAVRYAVGRGVTVVASGGNAADLGRNPTYPAAYAGVLGVASIEPDGSSSFFSNIGTYIDLSAPGGSILSTVPGAGYGYADGTSMAAPFVSATAALIRSARPQLTKDWVDNVLLTTAQDDAAGDGYDPVYGWGLLRADQAVDVATDRFVDVRVGTQFRKEILWLADRGISTGYWDGTYRPLGTVNRDAMSAFLYRLAGQPAWTPPAESPFSDIKPSTLFYKEMTWLAGQGIATGYPDGTFQPLSPVTRDAMAAFMYRFAGSPVWTPPASSPFKDVATTNQFYPEITWLRAQSISRGWPDGTYRPDLPVARDAMAAFMFRFDALPKPTAAP